MAAPTPYGKLNPAQQKIALAKWHARQDAKTPLTPAQQHKAALAQVVAPGLTQGDLNKIVGADTGLKYGQAETNLRQQPARINAAFAAYKQAINQAGNQLTGSGPQLGGSYGNAVQGVSNLASGLDTLSKDQWAGQQAAMQADATQRGATVDPALADQAHNASNIRNILTGSFGAQLLAQGQNTRQQYADRGVTAQQQQGESVGAARQKLADLLAEKGAFKVSDAASQISAANSNALKQYLANTTAANTASEIATRKSQTSIGQQNANTSATRVQQSHSQWAQSSNKYGVTNGEWANWSSAKRQAWIRALPSSKGGKGGTKPASGPGSLSSATEQKRLSGLRTIAGYFRNGVTAQVPVTQPDGTKILQTQVVAKPGDVGAVRNYLLQRKGVDPLMITVGLNLFQNKGKLDRAGVAAAHKLGVHVGGNFGIAKTGNGNLAGPTASTGVQAVPGVGQATG